MCISEFTADPYMVPISPFPNANLKSDVYLDAWGFFKGQTWKWGGVGYCLGFALLVGLGLSSLVVHYVRFREAPGAQRLREEEFRAAAQASAAALGRKPSSTALTTGVAVVDVDGDDALAPATVLPFSPVTLSFSDITYSVALPNKTETVSYTHLTLPTIYSV